MKNETQNLINVLLVVAIVLAIGGTWLNLNKLSEVKKVSLAGFAVAGVSDDVTVAGDVAALGDGTLNYDASNVDLANAEDCYVSTDNDSPGTDTTPCSVASSTNFIPLEWQLAVNKDYNITAYFTKTITTEYNSATLNHNYIGNVTNRSYAGAGVTNNAPSGTYLTADHNTSSNPVMLVENISFVPSLINWTINWGKDYHWNTSTGTYTNTLNLVVEW